jgi:hypothetical protein
MKIMIWPQDVGGFKTETRQRTALATSVAEAPFSIVDVVAASIFFISLRELSPAKRVGTARYNSPFGARPARCVGFVPLRSS